MTAWLESAGTPVLVAYAMAAAFSTYFFMHGFRKPFLALEYKGMSWFDTDVSLKAALMISQLIGYASAKYAGIKFCSEVPRRWRAPLLIGVAIWAEVALVVFAMVPGEWKVLAIFFNGIPLGMVWGLVVWYLEGRRTSDMLLAGLSCSYIIASGVVRDFGRDLIERFDVPELWMPAVAGACFVPLFMLAVWMLDQIPQPDHRDVAQRMERRPMDGRQRMEFLTRFLPGLVLLFLAYFLLTACRDFQENYGLEIFNALGYGDKPAIFTRTAVPISFGVLVALGMLSLVHNNRLGLLGAYGIMIGGMVVLGGSTLAFDYGLLAGDQWMICVGLGAFLGYVPFGAVLFDRVIASTHTVGTAVFAIYVADAIGYTGSISMQLYKDLGKAEISHLAFFHGMTYFVAIFGVILLGSSCLYFMWHGSHDQ